MSQYDLVILGSGPAGKAAAIQAGKLKRRVLVIDRTENFGGVSVHTGTIPSKTLRETVLNLSGWRERAFYGRAYRVKDDIRAADLVMYPQYPIKGYFVDFANPAAKVCIECDGSQWHQDTEKDAIRQRNIEAQGWTMYRITGRACKTDSDPETGTKSAAREFIDYIAEWHPVCRHPEDC